MRDWPTIIGAFDIDIALRDAALDETNSPTRRMIANALLGMGALESYYATYALRMIVEAILAGRQLGREKLAELLAQNTDDLERCLYFCLAGRGARAMLADLTWLENILQARAVICGEERRAGRTYRKGPEPYVSPKPDGPLFNPSDRFELGPSWDC